MLDIRWLGNFIATVLCCSFTGMLAYTVVGYFTHAPVLALTTGAATSALTSFILATLAPPLE